MVLPAASDIAAFASVTRPSMSRTRIAPVPQRPVVDVHALAQKRSAFNLGGKLAPAGQMSDGTRDGEAPVPQPIRRAGSIDNLSSGMEATSLGTVQQLQSVASSSKAGDRYRSASSGPISYLCHARAPHAYEMEAGISPLYLHAPDSGALRDLSLRVSVLLRQWMDSVTEAPVQSIFVGTPAVTVEKFMEHLMILLRRMKVEPFCILHVMHHIRELMRGGAFVVCWKNVFRLLLASSVVTVKFYTDERLYNTDFSQIIGLPVSDVNRLEFQFLALVRYRLLADEESLLAVRAELEQASAMAAIVQQQQQQQPPQPQQQQQAMHA